MQIEVWHNDNRYTMTLDDGITADDLMDYWCRMMLMIGYQPESVDSAILGKVEEIGNEIQAEYIRNGRWAKIFKEVKNGKEKEGSSRKESGTEGRGKDRRGK